MDYPIIYDKLTENPSGFLGYGLAIVENAKDICIHEVLNGEYTLSFALPINDPKWQYIVEENFVKMEGQIFVIRNISDVHGTDLVCTVSCEHVFFLLLDEYIEYLEIAETTSATSALTSILEGTEFTVDTVDVTKTNDDIVFIENQNPVAAINNEIKIWGGEIKVDNWSVGLLTHRGSTAPNIQFRYRKNMKSIKRTVDSSSLVTRLYVYGNDGLTIEDAVENTSGLKYIDSQYINDYRRPKKGTVNFDIDDPDELYTKALEYLAKAEIPAVSYEVDVIELKKLAEYGELEEFTLGDEAMVVDEELMINVQGRIIEYEHYPLEPARSKVTLANFRPTITNVMSELWDIKNQITTGDGSIKVKTRWFEGVINALQNQLIASGSYATAEVIEGKGLLFENTAIGTNDYGAMYVGPGIFAIANEKAGSPPTWNWRTFGTGKGFTADEITAGKIKAAFIQIGDETEFKEGFDPSETITTVGGWTFTGTTKIDGGQIQTDTILAASIKTGELIVGRNVGLGTAVNGAGVVTIVNGTVTADYINALQGIVLGANATITWGTGGVNPPTASDVGALTGQDLTNALTDYVTSGNMTEALADTLNTGNFSTIITKDYIASMNLVVGSEILMGSNAVITWANLTEESKANLKGETGIQGPQGIQGIQGPSGSDANVPSWITDWNNGTTVITSGYICSPKIFIGTGGQLATGMKIDQKGITSYAYNLLHGWVLDSGNFSDFLVYYYGELRGTIQQSAGNFAIYPGTNSIMILGTPGKTTRAKGVWDFTNCDSINFGGGTNITAKAVFS